MLFGKPSSYDKVPLEFEGSSDDDTLLSDQVKSSKEPPLSRRITLVSCLITLFCTILNVWLASKPQPLTSSNVSMESLPRPNQFIGLERINYEDTSAFDNITLTTFPSVLTQVDRANPGFVYPDDPRRRFTRFGTISPEDRQLLLTNDISSIVQFRARDWGMENCKLQVSLPLEAVHQPQAPDNSERHRDYILEGDTSSVEVWRVESPYWFNLPTLNYRTKPKRVERIDTLKLAANSTVSTRPFHCQSDQVYSFEIFCISPKCRVDIWQDKDEPSIGLAMLQRSSIRSNV